MSWLDDFWKNLFQNPGWIFNPNNVVTAMNNTTNDSTVKHILNTYDDPIAMQQQIATNGYSLTPEQEKYLDNLISRFNTGEAREWEEHMRDTALLSSGSQLEQLGLSSSGVLQTGGMSVNGVGAADNVKSNVALEKYQQRMAIAKQLLSMTSSMASAGVYGSAYLAAKKASGLLASQAAHSARVVTTYNGNNERTGLSISQQVPEDFDFSRLL